MSTSRAKENKLFFESKKWQRFVHFIYINDVISNLFTNINCEEIVYKALKYAYSSKHHLDKRNVTSIIDLLLHKSDYLDYFKSNLNKLKSLQHQNSKNIEDTLAEFDAPLLHSRLMLWSPVFEKWHHIFQNPKSDVYNIVYNSVQIILNKEKKSVFTFALNLGLKNPSSETYKKLGASLQCKHADSIRQLLKEIVLKEITPGCPYERGNGKLLFLTDKAIKQYSDNWDVSYIPSFNIRLNESLRNREYSSQFITDNECTVTNEDSVAISLNEISLSQLRKRKMSDLLLKHDKIDNRSYKRRKLHCSTESLVSMTSETNAILEEDHAENNDPKGMMSYRKEWSEERRNMLTQIKELENQKNPWNEDIKHLQFELDSKIEEINNLETELQEQETLKVLQELRLRDEMASVKKMNSELINKQGKMFVELNILRKEIEKLREGVKKEHQEKPEKFEENSHVGSIS